MRNRRIGAIIIFAGVVASGLSIRLFSLSVIQHDDYLVKAEKQQQVSKFVLPRRGEIYLQDSASGRSTLVAQSVERFSLSATPVNVKKKTEYSRVLAVHSRLAYEDVFKKINTDAKYISPLAHGLTKEEVETISKELNAVEAAEDSTWTDVSVNFDTDQGSTLYFISGVFFVREYERVYPEGPLLSQALGFVNDDGKGQYGFEGQYDTELKGYQGLARFEKDSLGNILGQKSSVDGKDGATYELTVDRNVQFVVERELASQIKDSEATGGSVIVMDPKTGGIIAMASQPTYDPNKFREIKQEDIGLFDNPSISYSWEPGSIIKPLVMAAALDIGLVTPETKGTFEASVTVDGNKIETALRKAYGEESMSQVLANSDNVAMVWIADKLGNQNLYDYMKNFGFGKATGIDLKNEINGNVLAANKWRNINRATISFGQGIAVTPLQVATAYAAVANNGKMIVPHVVKSLHQPDGSIITTPISEGAQVIQSDTAKKLRDMMVYTVEHAHSRAGTSGYKIGGKTGTAQVPDPEKGGYIEDAYNHSFVGIGPSDDPKYVMLVKIDRPNLKKVGIYAEGTAVPLFGRISTFLLNYYQIPPTNR